jgi:hypothetical protein
MFGEQSEIITQKELEVLSYWKNEFTTLFMATSTILHLSKDTIGIMLINY